MIRRRFIHLQILIVENFICKRIASKKANDWDGAKFSKTKIENRSSIWMKGDKIKFDRN